MPTYARDVKSIQTIVGAYVDGIYGPETVSKVKTYQTKIGVTADGFWGAQTEAAHLLYVKVTTFVPARSVTSIQLIVGRATTGKYDMETFSKVKTYQALIKTYVDGFWGPGTEKAHLAYVASQTPPPSVDPVVLKAAYDATVKADARDFTSIYKIVGHTGTTFDGWAYTKIKEYQKFLGTVEDGIWGLVTEISYTHMLAEKAAAAAGLSTNLVPAVNIVGFCVAAGFTGSQLVDAVSVALAESGVYSSSTNQWFCDPIARFVNVGDQHSIDRGVWQINNVWHPDVTDIEADNPRQAAVETYRISDGGRDFTAWATWNSGTAARRRPAAQAAVDKYNATR